jgi:hypothetical protein
MLYGTISEFCTPEKVSYFAQVLGFKLTMIVSNDERWT